MSKVVQRRKSRNRGPQSHSRPAALAPRSVDSQRIAHLENAVDHLAERMGQLWELKLLKQVPSGLWEECEDDKYFTLAGRLRTLPAPVAEMFAKWFNEMFADLGLMIVLTN